ncbi:unnamed protein product, partial [Polarella glacialis]
MTLQAGAACIDVFALIGAWRKEVFQATLSKVAKEAWPSDPESHASDGRNAFDNSRCTWYKVVSVLLRSLWSCLVFFDAERCPASVLWLVSRLPYRLGDSISQMPPASTKRPAQKKAKTARTFLFSSESVNEGHPDKLCDQVSDAVLDACLREDPQSKVACETVAKDNMVMVAGEITTKAKLDYDKIVRAAVLQIGYDSYVDDLSSVDSKGLCDKTCEVLVRINKQSPDIAGGVHVGKTDMDVGAGDQGIMFGYASDETSDCMPLTHSMATRLGKTLTDVRKSGECWWLRPDGKTQVTIEYLQHADGSVEPKKIHTVVISTQHAEPLKAVRSKECAGYKGPEMTAPSMEAMNKEIEEKYFEWENAKDLKKYQTMKTEQVTAALKASNYLTKYQLFVRKGSCLYSLVELEDATSAVSRLVSSTSWRRPGIPTSEGERILEDGHTFEIDDCVSIVESMARFATRDNEVILRHLGRERLHPRLLELPGPRIASVCYSYGALGWRHDTVFKEVMTAIIQEQEKLQRARVLGLSAGAQEPLKFRASE